MLMQSLGFSRSLALSHGKPPVTRNASAQMQGTKTAAGISSKGQRNRDLPCAGLVEGVDPFRSQEEDPGEPMYGRRAGTIGLHHRQAARLPGLGRGSSAFSPPLQRPPYPFRLRDGLLQGDKFVSGFIEGRRQLGAKGVAHMAHRIADEQAGITVRITHGRYPLD